MMIVELKKYDFNKRLTEVWGTYCEYQINYDYILVFKDGNRKDETCKE